MKRGTSKEIYGFSATWKKKFKRCGRNKMTIILQNIFSRVFYWQAVLVFWFKLHWMFVPWDSIDNKSSLVQVLTSHQKQWGPRFSTPHDVTCMMTPWHGNVLRITGHMSVCVCVCVCVEGGGVRGWVAGESTSHQWNPFLKGPVMRGISVSFCVPLNKLLSTQPSCRWFETP